MCLLYHPNVLQSPLPDSSLSTFYGNSQKWFKAGSGKNNLIREHRGRKRWYSVWHRVWKAPNVVLSVSVIQWLGAHNRTEGQKSIYLSFGPNMNRFWECDRLKCLRIRINGGPFWWRRWMFYKQRNLVDHVNKSELLNGNAKVLVSELRNQLIWMCPSARVRFVCTLQI
jgi:hypothetical protein